MLILHAQHAYLSPITRSSQGRRKVHERTLSRIHESASVTRTLAAACPSPAGGGVSVGRPESKSQSGVRADVNCFKYFAFKASPLRRNPS